MRILFHVNLRTMLRHFDGVVLALARRGHDVRIASSPDRKDVAPPETLSSHPRISFVEAPKGRSDRWAGHIGHLRVFRKYVREDKLLTLEEAIRKMTALPAQKMRLADRGVLKAGMWADLVVFDPAKLTDVATFAQPNQLSIGMDYVLVNGVPVIAAGKPTRALPGKVLRGSAAR